MTNHPELNELLQAVETSPENTYLRFLLIKKMSQYQEYDQMLEGQIQALLRLEPNHADAKEKLASLYFRLGKTSASIIIGEELQDQEKLSPQGQMILAKAYFEEKNEAKSRETYQILMEQHPELADDTLDNAFRMRIDESMFDDDMDDLFQRPDINFSDVGGMENIKKEIDLKIIKPLEHAELYATYGKKVGGGILLYGPPGCGKTFLAKATAGEINANFINVGLHDILDMWHGNSEKNMADIFDVAREKQPCVMFFDEIDALGAKRSDLRQSSGKNVINQFLSELDGIESDNEGLLIIGATNVPWHLDAAFRRPGRFDRIIFVPPPDVESKTEILKLKLKNKPIENIDYNKVAKNIKDYSGADINALVDIAVEAKLTEALETGIPKPITTNDLMQATKKHKASTIDWFSTAKNYAMFANQSGLYDDILKYLK